MRKLNTTGWDGDTYPIVSLAEGHISVVLRFKGVEAARKLAKNYGNELLQALKTMSTPRLAEAANNVVTFATTGTWKEGHRPEAQDDDLEF